MTAFQVILMVCLGALLVGTGAAWVKRWASRAVLAAWGGLWVLGLVAVWRPELTTRVAAALGIRRGADLLLYCTSVAMLAGFFMMYVRLRRVRSDLTVLTRQVAIMTAHEASASGEAGRGKYERNPNDGCLEGGIPVRPETDPETFLKTP